MKDILLFHFGTLSVKFYVAYATARNSSFFVFYVIITITLEILAVETVHSTRVMELCDLGMKDIYCCCECDFMYDTLAEVKSELLCRNDILITFVWNFM